MDTEQEDNNEKPQVFALKQGQKGWQFSRREFLVGLGAATTGALAAGCNTPIEKLIKPATPTATSTQTPIPTPTPTPQPTVDPQVIMDGCRSTRAHSGEIKQILISPDAAWMITCSNDSLVKLWSLPDGQLVNSLETRDEEVLLALNPAGDTLALLEGVDSRACTIKFYSLPDLSEKDERLSPEVILYDLFYSPDGKMLAAACEDQAIRLWSLSELSLIATLRGHTNTVNCVAFSPDGSRLYSGSDDHTVGIWSLPDGELITKMDTVHDVAIYGLAVSPDNAYLATYTVLDNIQIYSLPDGEPDLSLEGGQSMAFSSDAALLVHSAPDQEVLVWSIEKTEYQNNLSGHLQDVTQVALNPDGSMLVSGDGSGLILRWSLPEGKVLGCLMDLAAMSEVSEGITVETGSASGGVVTQTLPCGSPLPAGAVCTCNCVGGTGCSCVGHVSCGCVGHTTGCNCVGHVTSSGGHYWYPN